MQIVILLHNNEQQSNCYRLQRITKNVPRLQTIESVMCKDQNWFHKIYYILSISIWNTNQGNNSHEYNST